MGRPDSVKIGPQTFSIVYKKLAPTAAGFCHPVPQKIEVSTRQPEDGIKATIMHEVIHAILWVYVLPDGEPEDREEKLTRALAAPLMSVLQENPDLVAYLTR